MKLFNQFQQKNWGEKLPSYTIFFPTPLSFGSDFFSTSKEPTFL